MNISSFKLFFLPQRFFYIVNIDLHHNFWLDIDQYRWHQKYGCVNEWSVPELKTTKTMEIWRSPMCKISLDGSTWWFNNLFQTFNNVKCNICNISMILWAANRDGYPTRLTCRYPLAPLLYLPNILYFVLQCQCLVTPFFSNNTGRSLGLKTWSS